MRVQENTKQQLDKIKKGILNGQPAPPKTAEDSQRDHSSTKSDFYSSSVNAKITLPPFCGISVCEAGDMKAYYLTRMEETEWSQTAPIPSRAVVYGKRTLCLQVTHMLSGTAPHMGGATEVLWLWSGYTPVEAFCTAPAL